PDNSRATFSRLPSSRSAVLRLHIPRYAVSPRQQDPTFFVANPGPARSRQSSNQIDEAQTRTRRDRARGNAQDHIWLRSCEGYSVPYESRFPDVSIAKLESVSNAFRDSGKWRE